MENQSLSLAPLDPLLAHPDEQNDDDTAVATIEDFIISPAKAARLKCSLYHHRMLCDREANKLKLIYLASFRPYASDNKTAMTILTHSIIESKESLNSMSTLSPSGKIKAYLVDRMKKPCAHLSGFELQNYLCNFFLTLLLLLFFY
jgi:hypothetical protein